MNHRFFEKIHQQFMRRILSILNYQLGYSGISGISALLKNWILHHNNDHTLLLLFNIISVNAILKSYHIPLIIQISLHAISLAVSNTEEEVLWQKILYRFRSYFRSARLFETPSRKRYSTCFNQYVVGITKLSSVL